MPKQDYHPAEFESKWIERWEKEGTYRTGDPSKKNKIYTLVMFPYPSGDGLHTGHARVYTGTDVLARYYRMNGHSVLHPMGWDAFGLPAENAAIKAKKNPQELTVANIATFKKQMQSLGLSYDWEKEIDTTYPGYYAITQWLFIQFFKHGLLFKKETSVYYCEHCKTGLAQEEVMADGTHERCGNVATRKNLPQWIFRITSYAESLLAGLKDLDWPKGVLEMQKNWIGKKQGVNITYEIKDTSETVTCFTTRPDTNLAATFIVIAPEHELVQKILNKSVKIENEALYSPIETYIKSSLKKTERERLADVDKKTGVFTGLYAVNKLNDKLMPIWIADFVISSVGTGAVVGVPAYDDRDMAFAKQFELEINTVDKASEEVTSQIINKGLGKKVISYHLRDWVFSRQRYWGEPIPMVFCQKCADGKVSYWDRNKVPGYDFEVSGKDQSTSKIYTNSSEMVDDLKDTMYGWFPILDEKLPLKLPELKSYEPGESGESPLANAADWVETKCPNCGSPARRETDTMPNWAGSCWYFLAFGMNLVPNEANHDLALKNKEISAWISSAADWNPVDWYVGGTEHSVLHLLYARFWIHALYDMKIVSFREPFKALRNVGMVIAEDGHKMSKSKGNVINPDDVGEKFGFDTLRVYEMFVAPFNQEVVWSTQTLQGSYRFMKRIWQIYHDPAKVTKAEKTDDLDTAGELQRLILKISQDIPDVKFNTSIAALMEFLNIWEKEGQSLSVSSAKQYLQLLAPFAPFITEQIWQEIFNEKSSIHLSPWPNADQSLVKQKALIIPVQIDGKVRDQLSIDADKMDEKSIIDKAMASERLQKWLEGKKYKAVYIKGKILNLVTE